MFYIVNMKILDSIKMDVTKDIVKDYVYQIRNLEILEDEQIERISTLTEQEKMEIIKCLNDVIQSILFVL